MGKGQIGRVQGARRASGGRWYRFCRSALWAASLASAFIPCASYAQDDAPSGPDYNKVIKGALPTDPRYWDYQNWYIHNNAVVNLVVSGEDRDHLLGVLKDLDYLRAHKVIIGNVIISGGNYLALFHETDPTLAQKIKTTDLKKIPLPALQVSQELLQPSELRDLIQKLELTQPRSYDVSDIIKHYGISSSPVWIIRQGGEDYVYEGNVRIRKLFSTSGQFLSSSGGGGGAGLFD